MKHIDDHDSSVPLSNLFVSLALLDDLPLAHCERSGVLVETADLQGEEADWLDAASHLGTFRSYLLSSHSQSADLRIDVELTTPAGAIVDGETLIEEVFNQRAEELTESPRGTDSNHPHIQTVENGSLRPTVESAGVWVEERTDERLHARGETRGLERDVQCQVLPIGALEVDTRLRLDEDMKPSTMCAEYGQDDTIEPLDAESIDTATIGSTVIERLGSTLDNRDATDVLFGWPSAAPKRTTRKDETQPVTTIGLTDSDVSQMPFSVEATVTTIRSTDGLQLPTEIAGELPSRVALVEIKLVGADTVVVDSTAEATVWIPLSDADGPECSHTAFAEGVSHHAVEQYEWSAYRGETDDLEWHVWDPEEHGYIEAPAPTDAEDSSIARTHERADGERLVCPITDTDAVGITRIRPCGVGIIEVSCHTRLYRPSANRILGPVHDSRQALYAPLWTNVGWYSRQLVDSISGRADGLTPETLRLAQRT